MPPDAKPQLSLTWDQVAAFRLRRHHLAKRAVKQNLVPAVDDMAGAQAQLLSAARLSLWARVDDLQSADVDEALQNRELVKAACMRRTLFLLPAGNLAMYVRGTAQRAEKEIRWALGKGVPIHVIDRAIEVALEALDEPCTRPEIAERVSLTLGVQKQSIHGGGWGSRSQVAAVPVGELTYPVVDLLHLASARGVICYGPSRGNEPTFVRADAWVPGWRDLPREEAEGRLLRQYLRAFGPANTADFSIWTGITLSAAREIWRREQANFAPVNTQGWQASVLREDLEELAHARIEKPTVRLLPHFDSFLLAHKEREHLVPGEHHGKIYRLQGWISPVVLVDGRVQGTWEYTRKGKGLQIKVALFAPISEGVTAGIRDEADELGRFLGAKDVEIQVG